MPEARQLTFLENLASEKSDAQAAQLARARQTLKAAEEQLAQLQRYEGGYAAQLGAKLEASIGIDALRGHQRFMQNIAHAIRQQELDVARRRANADAIERLWQESERRRQGFRIMAGKLATAARKNDERQSQKMNDEFATRKPIRTNAGI